MDGKGMERRILRVKDWMDDRIGEKFQRCSEMLYNGGLAGKGEVR